VVGDTRSNGKGCESHGSEREAHFEPSDSGVGDEAERGEGEKEEFLVVQSALAPLNHRRWMARDNSFEKLCATEALNAWPLGQTSRVVMEAT